MPLLNRRSDETADDEAPDETSQGTDAAVEEPAEPTPSRSRWRRTVTVPVTVPERSVKVKRTVTVPSRSVERTVASSGVSLAPLVAVVAGVLLAVVGAVALLRAGIDESWFRPRVEVFDADHTALLGALEVGAGLLLVLVGLLRLRVLVAVLGLALALACTAVAIEPGEVQRELAIEEWWAWTLAGAGVVLTLAALQVPRERHRTVLDVT